MAKFIENTKNFFKGKPVRIIMALLVIGIIMTGIAFGIIAIVKAMSDPCSNQPGKVWNKDLKMCVQDNCKNICTQSDNIGVCKPANYCDYSQGELQYVFDENNCACTTSCSTGTVYNTYDNTINYTEMRSDPDNSNQYIPVNDLSCGSLCEATNEICDNTNTCLLSIDSKSSVIENGCLNNDSAADYNQCKDEKVYCKKDFYVCNNSVPENNTYNVNSYCDRNPKSLCTESGKEIICVSDDECTESDGTIGTCKIGTKNPDHNHPFNIKGYLYLGTCSNSKKMQNGNSCLNPNLVGENKVDSSTQSPTLDNILFNVTDSKNSNNSTGISLNQSQCTTSPECPSSNLNKKQPWVCNTGEVSDCEISTDGTNTNSCTKRKTQSESYKEATCCPKSKMSSYGDNFFCCPGNTVSDKEGTSLCTNNSQYPVDMDWLYKTTNNQSDNTCNTDNDCSQFESQLEILLPSVNFNDDTNPNYSKFFCKKEKSDDKTGTCHFFTGFIDKVMPNGNGDTIDSNNKYIILNNDDKKTSISALNNSDYKMDKILYSGSGTASNIVQCYNSSTGKSNTGPYMFGLYNESTGEKITDSASVTPYVSDITYHLTPNTGVNPLTTITDTDCLLSALNFSGAYVVNSKDTSNYNYNGGKLLPSVTGTQCNAKIKCSEATATVKMNNGSASELEWNFGNTELPKVGLQNMKFITRNSLNNDIGSFCGNLDKKTCENTKYVPTYWKGYESQFENSCYLNDSKKCVSKTCGTSNLPKYAITGNYAGQYNEKGYYVNNGKGAIIKC